MLTYEDAIRRVDAIVSEIGQPDVSLDRSLSLFQEGIGLLQAANASLVAVEADLKVLVEQADGTFRLDDAPRRA